jgi:hypothetical protein
MTYSSNLSDCRMERYRTLAVGNLTAAKADVTQYGIERYARLQSKL